MKTQIFATAVVIASLATTACSTVKNQVDDRSLQIEYAKQNWRLCRTNDCKSPSKKTVYLYEPAPVVMTPPPAPPQPIPAEITPASDPSPMIVHFSFGTANPTKEGKRELNDVLKRVLTSTEAVAVTGYTDSKGPLKVNERLARKRAIFIVKWLQKNGSTNKFRINSKGRCCYIQANKTEAGMANNRRSEIFFKGATSDTSHTSGD